MAQEVDRCFPTIGPTDASYGEGVGNPAHYELGTEGPLRNEEFPGEFVIPCPIPLVSPHFGAGFYSEFLAAFRT